LPHIASPGYSYTPVQTANTDLLQTLNKEVRRLQNIIANKKESHLNVTWQGMEKAYRSGKNWMKYIDENTKF
jgi:hypothetical protein